MTKQHRSVQMPCNLPYNVYSSEEPTLLEPVWIAHISSEPQWWWLSFTGSNTAYSTWEVRARVDLALDCLASVSSLLLPKFFWGIWAGCWVFSASNCNKKQGYALSAGLMSWDRPIHSPWSLVLQNLNLVPPHSLFQAFKSVEYLMIL